jgi:hypothetical protein
MFVWCLPYCAAVAVSYRGLTDARPDISDIAAVIEKI